MAREEDAGIPMRRLCEHDYDSGLRPWSWQEVDRFWMSVRGRAAGTGSDKGCERERKEWRVSPKVFG